MPSQPSYEKIRIASYSFVAKNAGSLASANFLIIEELLKRGYEIDLYGSTGSENYPEELSSYENFHYITLSPPKMVQYVWDFLNEFSRKGGIFSKIGLKITIVWGMISNQISFRLIAKNANENHRHRKYSLTLFLGLAGFFRINNIPTVSWLQGPFQTEWESIKSLKSIIISLCGFKEYLILKIFYNLFYNYSSLQSEKIRKFNDVFICGSQWSREKLLSWGLDEENVKILPYPIDTEFFYPQPRTKPDNDHKKVFLWLGRIVPRKRLDLLLEAFQQLCTEDQDVHLRIIGKFAYAKEYKKIIENFQFPERLSYQEKISRLDVGKLMNSVDILIQPSENENFGSSVAEALCCGVPVIVGQTNGTKDFIGSSSWVFEDYSVQSLKKTMKIAIDAIDKNRNEISLEARKTAEKEFNLVTIVDQLEIVFDKFFKQ